MRPPDSTSSVAMSSATRIALCNGRSNRLNPMRTRSVCAATAAASGMIDGEYPSSAKWCSVSQMVS